MSQEVDEWFLQDITERITHEEKQLVLAFDVKIQGHNQNHFRENTLMHAKILLQVTYNFMCLYKINMHLIIVDFTVIYKLKAIITII